MSVAMLLRGCDTVLAEERDPSVMWLRQWRRLAAFAGTIIVLAVLLALQRQRHEAMPPSVASARVAVTILAINDFHGNLRPPSGGISIADPTDARKKVAIPAGGAEHMATLVKGFRARKKNSVFVAAGDLIGASPLLSALFHDEPTIESFSAMGLEITAVGNHEFDEGKDELLRMQNGGCHPTAGCKGLRPFTGAKFRYLAASTIDRRTGQTLFPAYEIKEFEGIPVAFVGLALKSTPNIVSPSGVAGLEFRDEAETVNALVPHLRQRGIEAIVVLIHEGGFPSGGYNECPGISGPIVDIVGKLDKAVDVIVSGHTHRAYRCVIDGRLVTSADKFGTIVTAIEIELDRNTRDIVSARADNLIVRTDVYAKDPEQTALISAYDELVKPLAERPVGSITASLSRDEGPTGESVLGDIITDAQLAATRSQQDGEAVVAFTNSGGIRSSVPKTPDGTVKYADLFAAQPFGNTLVTVTMTGAQIKTLLEQQWLNQPKPRILQVSKGFAYTWDDKRQLGDFVAADGITLDDRPIDPAARYRVTVNSFLADGGDGFSVLKEGTNPRIGPFEVPALEAYFKANGPLSPHTPTRIRRSE
jgi:5'-nucleotidase